ncbi:hypothetical protein GDO86_018583 [Hymenochirus boettgeri]|uniref:Uncharacterized protein n=1 Tax=Hymenochirus boettgeri TaxID=247094 RepID=A0A8T2IDI1_9PIPI|nr:hypothetical protein GDO86_018583 [Hymenochirus boettgeri]
MLEGSCRLHPPTVSHPSRSVIQKENAKKILDLISNIIHLLTGEIVTMKITVILNLIWKQICAVRINQVRLWMRNQKKNSQMVTFLQLIRKL